MPEQCFLCKRQDAEGGPIDGREMYFRTCPTCGQYSIDALAARQFSQLSESERYAVIAAIRQRVGTSGPPTITSVEDFQRLATEARRWRTILEGVDRVLLLLADRARSWRTPATLDYQSDYPLLGARGIREMNDLVAFAHELDYIEVGSDTKSAVITLKGWTKVDQLRSTQVDSRQAFVAMWFDPSLLGAWERGLKEGIERSKYYRAHRVDAEEHNEKIDDHIVAEIRRSGLVVADFTGQRPGVYYEAGFARGLGITVISTCREGETDKLHFDTRQYNHIVWKTPTDLADQLDHRILATALPKGWAPLS